MIDSTKSSFLFCLGICVLICTAIYLKAKVSNSPGVQQGKVNCQKFPQPCSVFLTGTEGTDWQQKPCLEGSNAEAYFLWGEFNCSRMVEDFHFITSPLSPEEEQYPLAFIITIHKEMEMFVRLLRAVYAPQNVYCIHVDAKSPEDYKTAVQRLASCFPNVFVTSKLETVAYGGFSRLQADINCMRDLVKFPTPWRKVINLCGQDFPTMSNLELVRYLQSKEWREKNMTPGIKQPTSMQYRTQLKYREVKGSHIAKSREKKGAPPHNLEIYFGTAYYSLTRPFVKFVMQSEVARDLLEWSKDTYSPDEHYWVTLNHLSDAPGSNPNGGWEGSIRAIKWKDQEGKLHGGCKGHYVRDICVYGPEDLQWIIDKNSMFANKFELKSNPQAVHCLEQWHRHKVLSQTAIPIQPSWLFQNHTRLLNASRAP
ncbi:beta-1,3-galactosyl-O-glycosyl-glycoprotein beta-1,6-N-acetylglucosaminyltransferase 7 [Amia ocellicauda]|uniref:beta-1,3-galactosyl-O-glycosyl-glycoprotein beta-1,6-N-acetylglucosaminyltransferase 7 n=1 Tax=Amia ocellicauda TaxID=2972642 RepID=UPI003463C2B0